jgi:hypothetical protein
MQELSPYNQYEQRKQQHVQTLNILKRKQNVLGWIRLATIIIAAIVAYFTFTSFGVLGWVVVVIAIVAFLAIVSIDASNNTAIASANRLIEINNDELLVLQHNYQHLYDGSVFQPVAHPYAADIDLFGSNSIYQLVNRCQTADRAGENTISCQFDKPFTDNSCSGTAIGRAGNSTLIGMAANFPGNC